ncbi:unnamed protein product [Spirodela intermedia]|uniref:Uncharacterized protein n=1 Tax=Spirodela intermedia TaxID=51605 RepID=A0A7I8IJH5_SPIIN|nr:unnamed protein product [Spirodela intermedia]CAA6657910.1 unnamed protein product [Spirodela intermedia]
MQPPSWLLASTMTETLELPMFSGMWEVKRLLFRNRASSSLSKSSGGSGPSKSLNRRSRYLAPAGRAPPSGSRRRTCCC